MPTITSATKINEDNTSATKFLQVALGDATNLHYAIFSFDKVSGVDITHGGNAPYSRYLIYKIGTDDDYSDTIIDLVLAEKGTAVYTLNVEVCTKADYDSYTTAHANYFDTYFTDNGETMEFDGGTIPKLDKADDAPDEPVLNVATLVTSSIEFVWE